MQTLRVAQCVIAADRDDVVDAEEFQVLQNLGRQVVDLVRVRLRQMSRNDGLGQVAGAGARSVEKGAAGSARPVHHLLGERDDAVGVVGLFVANHVDQPRPTATDSQHAVSFAQRAYGDRADRRVETRYVTAAGQDADRPRVFCHTRPLPSRRASPVPIPAQVTLGRQPASADADRGLKTIPLRPSA